MTLIKILVIAYILKCINIALCCLMVHYKSYFHYFAYGSNLLKRRIHINNPSAVFLGAGRLDVSTKDKSSLNIDTPTISAALAITANYKLDFVQYNNLWRGAVATIVKNEEDHVWGAVWKMNNDSLISLDRQEGVSDKHYFPKEVDISSVNGKIAKCRTYQHCVIPPFLKSLSSLPEDRRPSITYKQCIVNGAVECHVPDDYIDMLKNIPNNGRHATENFRRQLNL